MSNTFCAAAFCSLALLALQVPSGPPTATRKRPSFLTTSVRNFDNQGKPLLPTLLRIAETCHIPMGIEQVTDASLNHPLNVRLEHGTVADLLDLSTSQLPGYVWTIEDGVVDIHGTIEWSAQSNLFNLRVPSFKVVDSTLNDANNRLRDLVSSAASTGSLESPAQGPLGVGGDSPGIGTLELKHMTISMEKTTVRAILNKISVLSASAGQQVVWVANVPPDQLARVPGDGLWRLAPVGRPLTDQH